jgi:uncharacterized cupin superfamily protein
MTSEPVRPVINIADLPLRDGGNGAAFQARIASFGSKIGSKGIGVMMYVVAPGQKAFPFHAHHQIHELFFILEGEGTYRFGDAHYAVKAGDVCAAPTGGAEVAHQLINTGASELKYLGFSTMSDTEVCEYPDSEKFAVFSRFNWSNPAAGGVRYVGRMANSLNYFDGEE